MFSNVIKMLKSFQNRCSGQKHHVSPLSILTYDGLLLGIHLCLKVSNFTIKTHQKLLSWSNFFITVWHNENVWFLQNLWNWQKSVFSLKFSMAIEHYIHIQYRFYIFLHEAQVNLQLKTGRTRCYLNFVDFYQESIYNTPQKKHPVCIIHLKRISGIGKV